MNLQNLKDNLSNSISRSILRGYTPKKKDMRAKTREEIVGKRSLTLKSWIEEVRFRIEVSNIRAQSI